MNLIEEILKSRGYGTKAAREAFLSPNYIAEKHDPFLLPDMQKAVERLVLAKKQSERVVVYGDYDIDGLTASTVLLDSLTSFGINTSVYIPNRFVEGYGLSSTALEIIADGGGQLVVTVDCGSLSHKEIEHANSLGLDVIVTDHHSVAETMPDAVAVINPKRTDHTYPFIDLAGVGVAFKLVQALQTRLEGLPEGQEKWLLDLVALGTVCDVVELKGENRANVFWGLKVMQQTRRPGIQLLMAVSGVEPKTLNARALGFGLGPRLNASGRLKTAQIALDLLTATDRKHALALAEELDAMNMERRAEQDRIFVAASEQALNFADDSVLVVSHAEWSHGIIGIVAAKLLEKYHKPTFVLQELDDGTAKGSARSFGDFSAVEGIRATETLLVRGGGHKLAAGVTIKTELIGEWRTAINAYHRSLQLKDQTGYMLAKADVSLEDFEMFDETLLGELAKLEPYGHGNPEPVFCVRNVVVSGRRTMGTEAQHVRYTFEDEKGISFSAVAWRSAALYTYEIGEYVDVWLELTLNEWRGRRSVEGRIARMEPAVES
jgi:single-stranded-DNA-specific exonuclease